MSFAEVARLADIPCPGVVGVKLDGQPVAVVRTEDGQVFAVEDRCSHADVALSEGDVDDCTIECWLHGSRFDLRTGQPLGPPAITPIRTFAVQTIGEGDDAVVLVSLSEPAARTTTEEHTR